MIIFLKKMSLFRLISLIFSLLYGFCAIANAQISSEFSLTPSFVQKRSLKPAEKHSYRILLKPNVYFHVDVQQSNVDISLTLIGPDKTQLVIRDRPNGAEGPESLSFITTVEGRYLLEIKSLDTKGRGGEYQITFNGAREPLEEDKIRVDAELLFQYGLQLYEKSIEANNRKEADTVALMEQSCTKYEKASDLSRSINDKYFEALIRTNLGYCRESLGDVPKAILAHEQALSLNRQLNHGEDEAMNLGRLCVLHINAQNLEAGLAECRQAITGYRELRDTSGEAELRSRILKAIDDSSKIAAELIKQESATDIQRGIDIFTAALEIYKELGDVNGEAFALLATGRANDDLGNKKEALAYYLRALPLYKKLRSPSDIATCLNNMGSVLHDLGDYQKALTNYYLALSIYKRIGEKIGIAATLGNIGNVFQELGRKREALGYYNSALPFFRSSTDKSGLAATLNDIGSIYEDIGLKDKARSFYLKALEICTESESEICTASVEGSLGNFYADLGETAEALRNYKDSLSLYRKAGDKNGEATTLNNLGSFYYANGERSKGLEYFEKQALPIYEQVGNRFGIGTTYNNIGEVYGELGEIKIASDYFDKALSLFRDIGSQRGIATTYNHVAKLNYGLGENKKALDYFELALHIYENIDDKAGVALVLNNIGGLYSQLGQFREALRYHEKLALPIFQKIRDVSGVASTFNNIGYVYSSLGDSRKALDLFREKALPLYEKTGNIAGVATTISNIGTIYYSNGEKEEALRYFNQALDLRVKLGSESKTAVTLSNIGSVYFDLGDKVKALDYYEKRALPVFRKIGDDLNAGTVLNNIGFVYYEEGKINTALDYFNSALPFFKNGGNSLEEAGTLNNIMLSWYELENFQMAIFYGKVSVNTYQMLRHKTQNLDTVIQKTFFKSFDHVYRSLINLLIEKGRLIEAHQVIDGLKDEQYFDFNRSIQTDAISMTFTPRETAFLTDLQTSISKIRNVTKRFEELSFAADRDPGNTESSVKIQSAKMDLEKALSDMSRIIHTGELDFHALADPLKDEPKNIDNTNRMQTALNATKGKAIAIYMIVGSDSLRQLVVTPDSIMAVTTPVDSEKLNNKTKQLWALLQSEEYDPKILSKEIYDLVFKPVKDKLIETKKLEEALPEGATILWSLDGNLRYLPMSGLYDGDKYLVEHYNNVVFTRVETERWNAKDKGTWSGLGFGSSNGTTLVKYPYSFPPLRYALKELNTIFKGNSVSGGIFSGKILANAAFTRRSLVTELEKTERHPLVHITSHFYFAPGREEDSFLLLGNGVPFTLSEMKKHPDLFHDVDLLTLSACRTAAQMPDSEGREIDGFAELAQRQGADSVIATLWNVRDDSSYWLMQNFYTVKKFGKLSKSEALRRSQLRLLEGREENSQSTHLKTSTAKLRGSPVKIKVVPSGDAYPQNFEEGVIFVEAKYAQPYITAGSSRYAHPYFWSPFILFGNWH